VSYERRASPLHAARAGIAAAWCVTVGLVALSIEQPGVLGAMLACVLLAGAAAGVWRTMARSLAWGVPFSLLVVLVNALVTRDGITVIVRGWTLPALGRMDITLEALAYSAILGLRFLIVIACAALMAACVDPDELLRGVRRVSARSGVTAAVAVRLVPVLARDARRLADAQRCRGDIGAAERVAVLRAVTAGALDRATDVAATLEVRGFAAGRRPPRRHRPLSRHDLAFAASGLAIALVGVAGALAGWSHYETFPRLTAVGGRGLAAVLAALILVPFGDRRGIE
jgi:energy-coupling factor transport system permease protein